jgi:hypothetical protein
MGKHRFVGGFECDHRGRPIFPAAPVEVAAPEAAETPTGEDEHEPVPTLSGGIDAL